MPNGYPIQNPARGKVYIDGGGSATAFVAQTGGRWVLTHAAMAYSQMVASATIALYEINSTDSNVIWQGNISATVGFANINLGDVGCQASATGTRLMMYTAAVAGTFTGIFAGYYTGN
jgi:hypothetical protein